jgi:hypothetical protein
VGEVLQAPTLTIVSLRNLYVRRPTLYKQLQWARDYVGLRDLDQTAEAALVAMLALHAAVAAQADELVKSRCHWLYDHRILTPGERRVQVWTRDAVRRGRSPRWQRDRQRRLPFHVASLP